MARNNTITSSDGIEVYQHMIYQLADDYISTLDNPDQIYGQNKGLFNGMIKHIYLNYFKNIKLNYDDIEMLDGIWDIYTSLCYKYNKRPTILNFSLMINISMDTLNEWKNGTTRQYIYFTPNGDRIYDFAAWKLNHQGERYQQKPSATHSETVKKWLKECEAALYDGATEQNSIGCIFALKANYGYTETAPIPTVNQNQRILSVSELPKLGEIGGES